MSITEHPSIARPENETKRPDEQQHARESLQRDLHDEALIAKKNRALAELIQSWIDDVEGAEEQRETLEYLMRALDEDHLSDRKLFP